MTIQVRFSNRAAQMIRMAVTHDKTLEVGGFGRVTCQTDAQGNDTLYVDDIIIPPQIVQGAHTNITGPDEVKEGEVSGWDWTMMELAKRGESFNEWRLWWHSHCSMGTTPSGTDTDTLRKLARMMEGWFLGMVTNVREENHIWMSINMPFFLTVEKIPWDVEYPMDDEARAIVEEYMKSVSKKVWNQNYTPPARSPAAVVAGKNSPGASRSSRNVARVHRPGGNSLVAVRKSVTEMTDEEFAEWVKSGGESIEKKEEPAPLAQAPFENGWGEYY